MTTLRAAAILAAAALMLTACSPSVSDAAGSPTTSASSTPSAHASSSPTPPADAAPAALVLALHSLTAVDASGTTTATADLADAPAVQDLLSAVLHAPSTTKQDAGRTVSTWDGVVLSVTDADGSAWVRFAAGTSSGVALRSAEGVSVGMGADEALAAGLSASGSSTDPSSGAEHTLLVSESEHVDGTNSLAHPGEVGSRFVSHETTSGTVSSIFAPGDDFSDL